MCDVEMNGDGRWLDSSDWLLLPLLQRSYQAVTDDASLVDDDAYPDPIQYDGSYGGFGVVRDYDCYLNLRCLHLPAVFASFFCSSCVDFGTWKKYYICLNHFHCNCCENILFTKFSLDAQSNLNFVPVPSAFALTRRH